MATCSACGANNTPGEMYCQRCGVQIPPVLSSPPPPPKPDEPGANRAAIQSSESGKRYFIVAVNHARIDLPDKIGSISIGRADPLVDVSPDIDLTPYGGDEKGVSRLHARIIFDNLDVYLEDLNSTNFTYLNNVPLKPEVRYKIVNGDLIQFGLLVVQFQSVPI